MRRQWSWNTTNGGHFNRETEFHPERFSEYYDDFTRPTQPEGLEEWEEVAMPTEEEMRNFPGTGPYTFTSSMTWPSDEPSDSSNTLARSPIQDEQNESENTKLPQSTTVENEATLSTEHTSDITDNTSTTETSTPLASRTISAEPDHSSNSTPRSCRSRYTGPELYSCSSCNGYHYISECIYLLPWVEWLDYHSTHMPSQPYPFSSSTSDPAAQIEPAFLRRRAEQLDIDSISDHHRPNYVSNSRLKADLMTKSSREMWYYDEEWKRKLEKKRRAAEMVGKKGKGSLGLESALAGSSAVVDGEMEDELARDEKIDWLRAEFGMRLPRLSSATLGESSYVKECRR